MFLFVDDERPVPSGWHSARASRMAITVLNACRTNDIDVLKMSLDHDLGGDDTTRPVVLWMCETEFWPRQLYIHTGNPVGEEWLLGIVRRYAPDGVLVGWGSNFWGTSGETQVRFFESGMEELF